MWIDTPQIEETHNFVSVSVNVRYDTPNDFPERLWFKFPRAYAHMLSARYEPFVVALIMVAMHLKENVRFQGHFSRRLYRGLQEYQRRFTYWAPDRFTPARIHGEGFCEFPEEPKGAAVAAAFSGGLDSLFTLRQHYEQPELPEDKVTHLLFMSGFDIPYQDEATYGHCVHQYQQLAQNLGIELITGYTNIRDFHDKVDWDATHGTALISTILLMHDYFSLFYIPGSFTLGVYEFSGTTPLADPLLSTRTLEIIHDATTFTRTDKITTIAEWPHAYDCLRVCWEKPQGNHMNCCQCEKCLRTMQALEILNKLQAFKTFPLKYQPERFRKLLLNSWQQHYVLQNSELAKTLGKHQFANELKMQVYKSRIYGSSLKFLRRVKNGLLTTR